jgi:glycosyltransferase involved in cell wall biosynthesis
MKVSVVIPTFNEAQSIRAVLADLPRDQISEVLVVDSNSTDATRDIAAACGARVVIEPRRGYGRACLTGIRHATDPDVIVFLDGDYSDRPRELPLLLEPIASSRADIVIGSRLAGRVADGALPPHSVWGNRIAAALIHMLCGVRLTDLGPFRAARAETLRDLELVEQTYGWPVEMIVKGALRGWRIAEVPVSYFPRIGQSKITGTLKGSLGASWCILSGIVRHRFGTPPREVTKA